MPRSLGWPDLARSQGVAAIAEEGEFRYVSFTSEEQPSLVFSDEPPRRPYLAWTNATLQRWSEDGDDIVLRLRGHGPIRFAVGGAPGTCTLSAHGRRMRPTRVDGRDIFSLEHRDSGDARLECGHR